MLSVVTLLRHWIKQILILQIRNAASILHNLIVAFSGKGMPRGEGEGLRFNRPHAYISKRWQYMLEQTIFFFYFKAWFIETASDVLFTCKRDHNEVWNKIKGLRAPGSTEANRLITLRGRRSLVCAPIPMTYKWANDIVMTLHRC